MRQLFDGRFVPLTFKIGFLNRSLGQVSEFFLQWKRQHFKDVEISPIEGGLETGLAMLEPLVTPFRRSMFLSTQSDWTAYFDNGIRGGDPLPTVSYLAEQLKCRGLATTFVPHTLETDETKKKGVYGAVQFEMFGPIQKAFLNCERSISVAFDAGKWRFDANGEIQPFENVARYSDRSIRERFTVELLENYCLAVGVRLFDEAFYSGPGMLVVVRDPLPEGSREVSLLEARREMAMQQP